jgi:hypothetical protein
LSALLIVVTGGVGLAARAALSARLLELLKPMGEALQDLATFIVKATIKSAPRVKGVTGTGAVTVTIRRPKEILPSQILIPPDLKLSPQIQNPKQKSIDASSKNVDNDGPATPPPGPGYHREVYENKPVRPQDAVTRWQDFLGKEPYTNIHPRTGLPDKDRIMSVEGNRSIRYGAHEMNSKPSKHHYHEETWTFDPENNVMNVDNTVVRVPLGAK